MSAGEGTAMAASVAWGNLVSLDYDAFLDTGEQVDSSAITGRLTIRVGEWDVLPGLSRRLIGLTAGEERLIRLPPGEAFGEWDADALLTMREARLAGDERLTDGTVLRVETTTGLSAVCRVYRLSADRVTLDFNHPLAGQPVNVYVKVHEVRA
ncbi:MAG: peptidylprolyl isomerase [Candidatus Methylomirabilales bacterium]